MKLFSVVVALLLFRVYARLGENLSSKIGSLYDNLKDEDGFLKVVAVLHQDADSEDVVDSMTRTFSTKKDEVGELKMLKNLGMAVVRAKESVILQLLENPQVKSVDPDLEFRQDVVAMETPSEAVSLAIGNLAIPEYSTNVNGCTHPDIVKVAVIDGGIDVASSDFGFCSEGFCSGKRFMNPPSQDWGASTNVHGSHVAGVSLCDTLTMHCCFLGEVLELTCSCSFLRLSPPLASMAVSLVEWSQMKNCAYVSHYGCDTKALYTNTFSQCSSLFVITVVGRVFNDNGGGATLSVVVQALDWAIEEGAHIINMSIGIPVDLNTFHDAIIRAREAGVLTVASAGNSGGLAYNYPAYYNETISVAAVDNHKAWARFSTFNDRIDIAAPGVNIISNIPGNQAGPMDGTSMSTPFVTGAAALMKRSCMSCSSDDIRACLLMTAEELPNCPPEKCGAGFLQAGAAYECLKNAPCCASPITTPVNPTTTTTTSTMTSTLTSLTTTEISTTSTSITPSTTTTTTTTTTSATEPLIPGSQCQGFMAKCETASDCCFGMSCHGRLQRCR